MYKKYVRSGDIDSRDLDGEIALEYDRQRAYLEKSVELLKRQLVRDTATHDRENGKVMRENMGLIKEIAELRKVIKTTKEGAYEVSGARADAGTAASAETLRLMEHQREEIGRIKARVAECEAQLAAERPGSTRKPEGGGNNRQTLPPLGDSAPGTLPPMDGGGPAV
jgi:hypothetical protein